MIHEPQIGEIYAYYERIRAVDDYWSSSKSIREEQARSDVACRKQKVESRKDSSRLAD